MQNKISKDLVRNTRQRTTHRGACLDKRRDKWVAFLDFKTPAGKNIHLHLGFFDTADEAVNARKLYILSLL